MAATTEHRAIVVTDIASFTDPARTQHVQTAMHEALYRILRTSFGESGVTLADCHLEDRGDGAMILVPPTFSKQALADQLPARLLAGLRNYNDVASSEAQLVLRIALHAGEVYVNSNGVVSQALNLAFRILDAKPAKSALAASGGMLALIASDDFYRTVIRNHPAAAPAAYRRIAVSVKKTETVAWLCLPERQLPATAATPPTVRDQSGYHQATPRPLMPGDALTTIVDTLLELPFVRDANSRQPLFDLLRPEITNSVPYQQIPRMQVFALVQTCLRHENGLVDLLEAVRLLDGDSIPVRRLEAIKQILLSDPAD
ncbi:MAG: hypothetical protein ABW215_06360 [Kibdelosporangium sp.]